MTIWFVFFFSCPEWKSVKDLEIHHHWSTRFQLKSTTHTASCNCFGGFDSIYT